MKRSNDRTKKDRAGDMARREHWSRSNCAQCDRERAVDGFTGRWWPRRECESCAFRWKWRWADENRYQSYMRSWYGRQENAYYRAEVKNMMQRGEYENLPRPRKTVRWNYG